VNEVEWLRSLGYTWLGVGSRAWVRTVYVGRGDDRLHLELSTTTPTAPAWKLRVRAIDERGFWRSRVLVDRAFDTLAEALEVVCALEAAAVLGTPFEGLAPPEGCPG